MRSLRRSLTLYFVALVGLGVAAVALPADRIVSRALAAKEAAQVEAIDLRRQELEREERERFDKELLAEARALAGVLQGKYLTVAAEFRLYEFRSRAHLLAASTSPGPAAVWASLLGPTSRGPRGPVAGFLQREFFAGLTPFDADFARHAEGDAPASHFIQVVSPFGATWRSRSLDGERLPPGAEPAGEVAYDDIAFAGGAAARRVVYRTPIAAFGRGPRGPGGPGRGAPGPPPGDGPPPMPPPDRERDRDPFFRLAIHYARPTAARDAALEIVGRAAADRTAFVRWQTRQERARVRFWLALVGGAAFLATVVGGPVFIARGLSPVRKLSDAVGRVSERDFRLPVESGALSRELLPIHARLTDTLDALRRAFTREKQAVADISHELRTPIAGLMATFDVALRRPRSAEQYRTALEEGRLVARQLGMLVERVMALANLDAGAREPVLVECDAAEVAAACAAVIRPLARAQGLEFASELSPAPLRTDPHQLREVVTNLLHNAVEYNRPGGSITLTTESAGGAVRVTVRDTGIGMSPEVRARIFERFYRADASRTAAGVHAGLGLSLVKESVEKLGGAVAVESEPGAGSAFTVTLPAGGG